MSSPARSRALSHQAVTHQAVTHQAVTHQAVTHQPLSRRALSRRRLLTIGGLSAGVTLAAALPTAGLALAVPPSDTLRGFRRIALTSPPPKLPADLYQLGVASGDPLHNSVVLWTRLAPKPLDGGGMPDRPVLVEWEVATEESFGSPVRQGTAFARSSSGHSVHVEANGLQPDTTYFYRFRAGGQISPVGRTRTAPLPTSAPDWLRLAVASCQNYQQGYFVAHRDLADQDVDVVLFLGDYIYESKPSSNGVRRHEGTGEPRSLTEYRNRYARYKTDADLRAAHASFPWIVSFDDHEVDNDWAGSMPQNPDKQRPAAFKARRAAAFQAWYEHMPVRRAQAPLGASIRAYRRFEWGDLARIHVLDTRQYRTDQATTRAQADAPYRTMTGPTQERWLVEGLTSGPQQWNLVANQVPMAQTDTQAGRDEVLWTDPWDGYRVQRRRLFDVFGSTQVANPLVLSGDRHFTMACDLVTDFDDPKSPAVAAELVNTSLTSNGDEDQRAWHRTWDRIITESPYWKYGDGRRGYVVCEIDRDRILATTRIASKVGSKTGSVSASQQFVVQAGRRGIDLA